MSDRIWLGITVLSSIIWIYLLGFRGQFWRSNQRLNQSNTELESYPSVCAVIPARNEAELLAKTLRSLLNQDYPGSFSVILVDDQSTDGTAKIAREVAETLNKTRQLEIISANPLPPGWTGKLWALEQGICHAQKRTQPPDYFLFTDADIEHDRTNLRQLVIKAKTENLNLVSLMVLLRCQSLWEKILIPAFIFFFQKIYPFPWVNDPKKATAAAAGGCILIEREALDRIGGIQIVRQALIDDCSLAQTVKFQTLSDNSKSIWLGLTTSTRSLRPYPSLASIWNMVARTAFTQLNYSSLLLMGTLLGMTLVYLVPPLALIIGGAMGNERVASIGLVTWLLMTVAYLPTIRLYKLSPLWAVCLPAIAFLYTLMTIDSALRHWYGQGGAWKGRVYPQP
jgi:hopene-associated glycosyltransferase HpnB